MYGSWGRRMLQYLRLSKNTPRVGFVHVMIFCEARIDSFLENLMKLSDVETHDIHFLSLSHVCTYIMYDKCYLFYRTFVLLYD